MSSNGVCITWKEKCALYAVATVDMSVVGAISICLADIYILQAEPCNRSMLAPLECIQNDMSDFSGVCSRFLDSNKQACNRIYTFIHPGT